MFVREYKFAGRYYPEKPRALISMLQDMFQKVEWSQKKIRPLGILLPHAAYRYSGVVSMSVLKSIEIPENIIILAPNHSGLGEDVSIISEGRFVTPIGDVPVNTDISKMIIKNIPQVIEDHKPHIIEHSIEVQLPILKYMRNDIKIVPILMKRMLDENLNRIIAKFKEFVSQNPVYCTLFLSTSDLSHYENNDETARRDRLLLKYIESMDVSGLKGCMEGEKISMCGFEPTALNMEICKSLGASGGILRRYDTSSAYDFDYDRVVGYAGVCFV